MSLPAAVLFALVPQALDGQVLDRLREVPCPPANRALEQYEAALAEAIAAHKAALDPLAERWRAVDDEYESVLGRERAALAAGLDAASTVAARRREIEEALMLEEARRLLAAGADVTIPDPRGRPRRGSKKFAGHYYLLIDEKLDWHAARAHCIELGGSLACAETDEELAHLATLVKSWTWIGASDADREGDWKWLTGTLIGEVWASNQPDDKDGREHAAALDKDGEMHDRPATERSRFLCEWGTTQAAPWAFTSRGARRAKERYDAAVRAASGARDKARAKSVRESTPRREACLEAVAQAREALVRALDEAIEREVRLARADIALEIREVREVIQRGAAMPRVPRLGAAAPPEGALAHGSGFFQLFPERVPWESAHARCVELGGRLACASDPDLRAFLERLAPEHGAWVGGRRGPDGTWLWSDGSAVDDGWHAGEPNNGGGREDALLISGSGLFDVHPEERRPWVCEW